MSSIALLTTEQGQEEPKKARYQFTTQYVTDLRQVTGYYVGYVSQQSERVADYDLIKNDESVKHALHLMSVFAAGETIEGASDDEDINLLINFCLAQIDDCTHARKSLIEQGILFGLGVQRKYREMRESPWGGIEFDCVVKLKEVDRRRMRLERDVTDRTQEYWTIWNPSCDAYQIIEDLRDNPRASLAMQDFVWYVHEHEELNPYYRGLGEVLWRAVYLRSRLIQYAGDLAESWGKPIVMAAIESAVLAINSAGNLKDGFYTAQKVVDGYLDQLNKMRSRSIFVHPSQDRIDVRESGNTGSNIISSFLEYIDSKIELLILGTKLVSNTSDQGSFALGQIHRSSTQSLVLYNRARLQEVIKKEILVEFFRRNKLALATLGIPMPRREQIKTRIRVYTEELKASMLQRGKDGDRKVRAADKM